MTATLQKYGLKTIEELKIEYLPPKEEKILEAIRTISEYEPLATERGTKNNALERLIDEWFRLKMSQNFPELSTELFELNRPVRIDLGQHKAVDNYSQYNRDRPNPAGFLDVEIPLFCATDLKKALWNCKINTGKYEIILESSVPKIPDDAIKEARDAKHFAYKLYMEALETFGDVLTHSYFPEPGAAELKVLWYARPNDLKVQVREVNKDPAIVMDWNRPYLIYQWDENTLPIENILLDALKV